MEFIFMVIAVFIAAWFFGFLRSIRSVADMANKEVATLSALHQNTVVERLAAAKVTAAKAQKAQANLVLLNSIDLFAEYDTEPEEEEEVRKPARKK